MHSAFTSIKAKAFLLPTPVMLVGTYDKNGKPNAMVATWGGICASQPPSLAVSIRKSRWTHNAILERKAFTVSIPPRHLAAQADFMGMYTGAEADKFAALDLTPVSGEHVDAPYVAQCPLVIELTLSQTLDVGSHTQFIGEIMDVKVHTSCLREDGEPDVAAIDPLLFAPVTQEYWGLGEFVARAFSAGHMVSRTALLE